MLRQRAGGWAGRLEVCANLSLSLTKAGIINILGSLELFYALSTTHIHDQIEGEQLNRLSTAKSYNLETECGV